MYYKYLSIHINQSITPHSCHHNKRFMLLLSFQADIFLQSNLYLNQKHTLYVLFYRPLYVYYRPTYSIVQFQTDHTTHTTLDCTVTQKDIMSFIKSPVSAVKWQKHLPFCYISTLNNVCHHFFFTCSQPKQSQCFPPTGLLS